LGPLSGSTNRARRSIYRKEHEMSRRKSTKKVRERRRSLKNVKPRRQMNGRKAGATDRGRIKGMGIGGWA
jgi:hypothetical protein